MPTELTRAREIIMELEINSKELLAEYFTHTEKALFILINDTHFFTKCYDMLSIHAQRNAIHTFIIILYEMQVNWLAVL